MKLKFYVAGGVGVLGVLGLLASCGTPLCVGGVGDGCSNVGTNGSGASGGGGSVTPTSSGGANGNFFISCTPPPYVFAGATILCGGYGGTLPYHITVTNPNASFGTFSNVSGNTFSYVAPTATTGQLFPNGTKLQQTYIQATDSTNPALTSNIVPIFVFNPN